MGDEQRSGFLVPESDWWYTYTTSIDRWDDSGALENLQQTRERKRARDLKPSPWKPDLFNQEIDWSCGPLDNVSPEVRAAWSFILDADKKNDSRRRGGRRRHEKLQPPESYYTPLEAIEPTGWEIDDRPYPPLPLIIGTNPEQDFEPSSTRNNKDAFQEQQRFKRSENWYTRSSSSGWGNRRQNNTCKNKTGVWKPKGSTNFSATRGQENYNRQPVERNGNSDWNRREYNRW